MDERQALRFNPRRSNINKELQFRIVGAAAEINDVMSPPMVENFELFNVRKNVSNERR